MHSDAFDVIPYEVRIPRIFVSYLLIFYIGYQRRLEEIRVWFVWQGLQR
jgi:hypothetical protein